ncbi:hypothetical protein MKW98_000380 [Papaver atlanticum]|uniref:Uncharacterized protein n=1 Tax=Papaver atlanticum TaxID=357466 RepID=A0AAD4X7Q4_9MAGN|nr:hypothetical protein MKW98_000380 [Papaver atlanticum]
MEKKLTRYPSEFEFDSLFSTHIKSNFPSFSLPFPFLSPLREKLRQSDKVVDPNQAGWEGSAHDGRVLIKGD